MQELNEKLDIQAVSIGLIYVRKDSYGAILDGPPYDQIIWLTTPWMDAEFQEAMKATSGNLYKRLQELLRMEWRIFRFGLNEKDALLTFHLITQPDSKLHTLLCEPDQDGILIDIIKLKEIYDRV